MVFGSCINNFNYYWTFNHNDIGLMIVLLILLETD